MPRSKKAKFLAQLSDIPIKKGVLHHDGSIAIHFSCGKPVPQGDYQVELFEIKMAGVVCWMGEFVDEQQFEQIKKQLNLKDVSDLFYVLALDNFETDTITLPIRRVS